MSAPPGIARPASNTVHLTDKKVPEGIDRALMRRTGGPPGDAEARPLPGGTGPNVGDHHERYDTSSVRRGCPCGCVSGERCVTTLPLPSNPDAHCCSTYTLTQLAKGYGCPRHRAPRWRGAA